MTKKMAEDDADDDTAAFSCNVDSLSYTTICLSNVSTTDRGESLFWLRLASFGTSGICDRGRGGTTTFSSNQGEFASSLPIAQVNKDTRRWLQCKNLKEKRCWIKNNLLKNVILSEESGCEWEGEVAQFFPKWRISFPHWNLCKIFNQKISS